jgi:hypothetical protein
MIDEYIQTLLVFQLVRERLVKNNQESYWVPATVQVNYEEQLID